MREQEPLRLLAAQRELVRSKRTPPELTQRPPQLQQAGPTPRPEPGQARKRAPQSRMVVLELLLLAAWRQAALLARMQLAPEQLPKVTVPVHQGQEAHPGRQIAGSQWSHHSSS